MTSSDPPPIPVIALVGGIGAGKSTVARIIGELLPALLLNADTIGHEVLRAPAVRDAIVAHFGPGILGHDGHIVRSQLALQVFGDGAAQVASRARLEQITHPAIQAAITQRIFEARKRTDLRLIVLDAPVLLESGWASMADRILFVDAPEIARQARVASRGWSPEDLHRRELSQWSLERKRSAAHDSVWNRGSLAETRAEVQALLHRWGLLPEVLDSGK